MSEWLALTMMLALVLAFAILIRIRLGPVAPARFVTPDFPQRRFDPWETADDGLTTFPEQADEGLIIIADLERYLPAELRFHGRVLTRRRIQRWWIVDRVQQYLVFYRCDQFFDCKPRFPFEAHRHLSGMMRVDRVPAAQLPDIVREQLRELYWSLELEVEEEATRGCSILPPTSATG